MDGDRVVYHFARRGDNSTIEEIYLPTRRRTTLRTGRKGAQLLNPSELGGTLLYISSSSERQRVRIGPRRARSGDQDRRLLAMHPDRAPRCRPRARPRAPRGRLSGRQGAEVPRARARGRTVTLWSTALAPDRRLRQPAAPRRGGDDEHDPAPRALRAGAPRCPPRRRSPTCGARPPASPASRTARRSSARARSTSGSARGSCSRRRACSASARSSSAAPTTPSRRSRRPAPLRGVCAASSGNHAQALALAAEAVRDARDDPHAARRARRQARRDRGLRRRGHRLRSLRRRPRRAAGAARRRPRADARPRPTTSRASSPAPGRRRSSCSRTAASSTCSSCRSAAAG